MAKKKTFNDCIPSIGMGALSGFLVGGGMAGITILGYSLLPSMRGNRVNFLKTVGVKAVLQGGGAFGAILGFGGLLRCI
ncbi:hypothetical protein FDP41_010010 [Naegleria fowleri]|uniref:Reactive oxygen species modulator 1 n=1 Tax=Naegleria fowleri TaxID=5763 RepID=A0A6A5AZ61_NAEFO|nr:uncharacterized protein FDP41_010010 [Naegleria fowleri]KAF0971787.1 hypothetical protein FDP41_010010 [Naegleria fowleri]CAG4709125.1 unnamed protein product [Naegleria fowleri]